MAGSINTDRRRSMAPPAASLAGPTVQPVRLSVSRYASLDEGSGLSSFAASPAMTADLSTAESADSGTDSHIGALTPATTTSTTTTVLTAPPSVSEPSDGGGLVPFSAKGTRTTAVIGRLTSSLDTIKRDLRAERTQHEETLRSLASAKQRIEALQSENNNLIHSRDTAGRMLDRRDAKINELKTQLETETRRREMAETAARDMNSRLDEVLQTSKKDVADARDAKSLAESQYAAIRGSFSGYKTDVDRIKRVLKDHRTAREEDVNKIIMLEAVCDRQAAEVKRADALVKAMSTTLDGYRTQAVALAQTQAEMETVRDQMNWVIKLQAQREPGIPPG